MRGKFLSTVAILVFLANPAQSAEVELGKLEINGFIDMSYSNTPNSDTSSFGMDQIELDVTHKINAQVSSRFDLQFVNGETNTTDQMIEQGYIAIELPSVAITLGKFNAPIGFELLDAPDMYQYSHALVFDNGLPTNLTGVMVSGSSGPLDYSLYVVNGWDLISDDNTDKTIGGRLGFTPHDGLNMGFSAISGKEGADPDQHTLTVYDFDLTYTGIDKLTIGAEYNSGTDEKQSATNTGQDENWNGYLVMGNYAFSDFWALTLRYGSFNDDDGARLGGTVSSVAVSETRNAFTISPSFALADGLLALVEYRMVTSDKNVFTDKDGNPKDDEASFAAEITYSF